MVHASAGDALGIYYQRAHPVEFDVEDFGYGWFYLDDSGMGANAMHVLYLVLSTREPWWPIMFLASTLASSMFIAVHNRMKSPNPAPGLREHV